MTRRAGVSLGVVVAGLFSLGVWAAGLADRVADKLADAINERQA